MPYSVIEIAAEKTREHAIRQKELRPARYPVFAIGRNAAARNDAMDMGMVIKVLTPCMQYGGEADLSSQMFGISGDRHEGPRGGFEQKPIDRRLVLIGDCADFGGQREYDVIIGRGQEVRLPRRQPSLRSPPLALGTMAVAAGIIGDTRMSAGLATLDVTAERRCATNLNRRHDAALGKAQMASVGHAPCLAVATEDIRHFQLRF